MITNGWTPIDTWSYAIPDALPETILCELPLSAYPVGTTMEKRHHSHGIEPGARIGYSATWGGHVVFPRREAHRPAIPRKIGMPLSQALLEGYVQPAEELKSLGLWK